MTVELIQGLLLAFAIVVILMPPYIRLLRATGFTKQIRIEGPDSHQVKHGTPTMGGVLVIAIVLALYLLLRWPPEGGIFAPLAALAGVGLLGAFDDYLNAKTGEGIRVRQKLAWQIVVAFVAAWQIQRTYAIDQIAVPFVGPVAVAPWVFVLFAAFAIIAASNGVNITDGLDGLAGIGRRRPRAAGRHGWPADRGPRRDARAGHRARSGASSRRGGGSRTGRPPRCGG